MDQNKESMILSGFNVIHVNIWVWGITTLSVTRRKELGWTLFLSSRGSKGPMSVFSNQKQPVDKVRNCKNTANPSWALESRQKKRYTWQMPASSHCIVMSSLFHRHYLVWRDNFLNSLRGKNATSIKCHQDAKETQLDLAYQVIGDPKRTREHGRLGDR